MPFKRNSPLAATIVGRTQLADFREVSGTVSSIMTTTEVQAADVDDDWIAIAPIPSDALVLSIACSHEAIADATDHKVVLRRESPDGPYLADLTGTIVMTAARPTLAEVHPSSAIDLNLHKVLWEHPNTLTKDPNETFWLTHELKTAGSASVTVKWRILYTVGL